jgi:hypothetical protein
MDGGYRTGIELDRVTLFERFEEGEFERDPALRWYIDLRCQGSSLPDDPEAARQWLLDQSPVICEGFRRYADQLAVGVDPDDYPLLWDDFRGVPVGVRMTIASSAIRKVDARELDANLRDVASHWTERIESLGVEQPVLE